VYGGRFQKECGDLATFLYSSDYPGTRHSTPRHSANLTHQRRNQQRNESPESRANLTLRSTHESGDQRLMGVDIPSGRHSNNNKGNRSTFQQQQGQPVDIPTTTRATGRHSNRDLIQPGRHFNNKTTAIRTFSPQTTQRITACALLKTYSKRVDESAGARINKDESAGARINKLSFSFSHSEVYTPRKATRTKNGIKTSRRTIRLNICSEIAR
jgi:hypothetical protein